ncbi:SCO family protein [bacterium]|nr:SCO family protein [bacterium]
MVYNYISKGSNNFVKLAVIGGEDHKIPPFTFINQNKDTVNNFNYNGSIYISNFFFTSCPTICPVMTYNMKYLQHKLSIYPNVKFLSHSVNPDFDTPERLKDYIKSMRVDDSNWNFVTGNRDSIYKIAKFYFASASVDDLAPGGFLHSEQFMIIDKDGRVRSGYSNFVCNECGDISKKSKISCPTTGKNYTYEGNPVGSYDGTKDHILKELIKDVETLLAEYHVDAKVEKNVK